jgi:uncharacterized damage-inducible protein DinB
MNLQEKLKINTFDLFNALNLLTQTQATFKPAESVWSILECLEHIFLVNQSITKNVTSSSTENHLNDKTELFGEEKLHHILVNKRDALKVPAPPTVLPNAQFSTIEEAKKSIQEIIDQLILHISSTNISEETQTIKHPRLGEMTKVDWIHFLISHTKRHILQIEELKKINT